ncbi:hypothetical protein BKA70DRAFT_1421590 [Coprinopsis sp. MPI-PUGE-AT-0042]|nr:hypothetical protein BKA70DRAFT_1421590 [Coprinopsis sp. MPI-PUGE-AT-0042]
MSQLALLAVLYYEYFLTLPREVAWIWRAPRRISWLDIIFYVNRYLVLFGQIGVIIRAHGIEPLLASPSRLEANVDYFGISVQLVVGAFMIVRVSALYSFNRRVMAVLTLVGLGCVVNGVVSVSTTRAVNFTLDTIPINSCMLPNDDHNAHRLAIAWAGLLAFDIVIFLFTLVKALREPALGKSAIMQLLLRDGAIYFAIMSLMTVATVASYLVSQPYARGSVTSISNVVSSCLATRLILNMRNPALLPRSLPAIVKDPHAPFSTIQWVGQKGDDEETQDDEKATFDLIVTEGDIWTQSSERESELNSYREDFRKSRNQLSHV